MRAGCAHCQCSRVLSLFSAYRYQRHEHADPHPLPFPLPFLPFRVQLYSLCRYTLCLRFEKQICASSEDSPTSVTQESFDSVLVVQW